MGNAAVVTWAGVQAQVSHGSGSSPFGTWAPCGIWRQQGPFFGQRQKNWLRYTNIQHRVCQVIHRCPGPTQGGLLHFITTCTIWSALDTVQTRFHKLHPGHLDKTVYYRVFLDRSATHLMMSLIRQNQHLKVETCFLISGAEGISPRNTCGGIFQYHSQWVPLSNWSACHRGNRGTG